jgi:hypothetical protein
MVSCHPRNGALALRFVSHSGARASANPESISPALLLTKIPDRLAALCVRNDE